MNKKRYVLVINPGSTSTKLALYNMKAECIVENSVSHSKEEIEEYDKIYDQKDMRTKLIIQWVKDKGVELNELAAVVGRGGLLRPMPGGTYKVTDKMLGDLKIGYQGEHASNLGGIIANEIARRVSIDAYIVDPVAVDEMIDVARLSGITELPRRSLVHALNIKAVARRVCKDMELDLENSSFVIAHLGGGISVSPVLNGAILDANNANEAGPFSPERAGSLPVGEITKMAFSGEYTPAELKKKIVGKAGLVGYLGTNDGREVDKMIEEGNEKAKLIFEAMGYQISKEIGGMSVALKGKIDAIILTGGLAYNERLTNMIQEKVAFIAPVKMVPGEDEMLALAQGAIRVLNKEEEAKIYENEVQI